MEILRYPGTRISVIRGFEIGYPMYTPLMSTKLSNGETLIEEYNKSGGYSDQDNDGYIDFIN